MKAINLLYSLLLVLATCSFVHSQSSVALGAVAGDGFQIGKDEIDLQTTFGLQLQVASFLTNRLEVGVKGAYFHYSDNYISEQLIGLSGSVSQPLFVTAALQARFFGDTDRLLAPYASLGINALFSSYEQSAFGTQSRRAISPETGLGLRLFLSQSIHIGVEFNYLWRQSNSWQSGICLHYNAF
jgi:hypothetical protein